MSALLPPIQIGTCAGFGFTLTAAGGVAAALEAVLVGAPHAAHRLERLVEQLVAPLEVDAERAVLAAQVAGRDREREAPTGQRVDGRRRLGHEERVAVGQHDDVRDQPDPLGHRGDEGQRGERVERVVTAGLEPLVRRRRVVGERDAVEPGGLGGAGEAREALPDTNSGLYGWAISG